MEQMLKTLDELPEEEKQKVLAKMLENSEDLNPSIRNKLMDEMVKNINQMPPREREKFLAGLYLNFSYVNLHNFNFKILLMIQIEKIY